MTLHSDAVRPWTFACLALLGWGLLLAGCESKPPEEAWEERWGDLSMEEQPQLVERRHDRLALADLDELYLGQPADEARSVLRDYCGDDLIRREAGLFKGDAHFLGCRLEGEAPLRYVRVGFWPKFEGRVATLEIKRDAVPPPVVRRRYSTIVDEASSAEETLKRQLVILQTDRYRLYADWDEGFDGRVHMVVGFVPDVERIE